MIDKWYEWAALLVTFLTGLSSFIYNIFKGKKDNQIDWVEKFNERLEVAEDRIKEQDGTIRLQQTSMDELHQEVNRLRKLLADKEIRIMNLEHENKLLNSRLKIVEVENEELKRENELLKLEIQRLENKTNGH